jgi:hypothetical protein
VNARSTRDYIPNNHIELILMKRILDISFVHSDKIFESQIILKVFGSKKAKVHKQDRQNQLRSSMPEGGEQMF